MRPKIRDLINKLEKAGFVHRDSNLNHMNFRHTVAGINITLSGEAGDIARHYIINDVINALYLTDNV